MSTDNIDCSNISISEFYKNLFLEANAGENDYKQREFIKPFCTVDENGFAGCRWAVLGAMAYICKDEDFFKKRCEKYSISIKDKKDTFFGHGSLYDGLKFCINGKNQRTFSNLLCTESENRKENNKTGFYNKKVNEGVTGDLKPGDTIRKFCYQIYQYIVPDKKEKMRNFIKEAFGIDISEDLMINKLRKKVDAGIKQIILHGAPGTGKTYTAEEFAKEQVKNGGEYKVIQFHPSFDYTDFVEGLRPVTLNGDNPTFVRMDGVLKSFCRMIVENNKEDDKKNNKKNNKYFLIIDEINRADLSKVLGDLMYCMNDPKRTPKDGGETRTVQTPYQNLKTYADEKYSNEKDEDGYIKNDVFKDGFYLPENLYIIGTMNDIDRSVESFDFALRRRFDWIEADANTEAEGALKNLLENVNAAEVAKVQDIIKNINSKIYSDEDNKKNDSSGTKLGLSKDYHIGHAYFKSYNGTPESLKSIWEDNVKPILKEYCRGRNQSDAKDFIDECEKVFL